MKCTGSGRILTTGVLDSKKDKRLVRISLNKVVATRLLTDVKKREFSYFVINTTRRSTIGDRVFAVAGPRAWNSLPYRSPSTWHNSFKNIFNHSCLDNLFVCDNVHTDYVSALVAVCTAYCALQIVMFTSHYITYSEKTSDSREWGYAGSLV